MDDNKARYSLIKMKICFLFIVLLAADSDSDRAIFRAEMLDFLLIVEVTANLRLDLTYRHLTHL